MIPYREILHKVSEGIRIAEFQRLVAQAPASPGLRMEGEEIPSKWPSMRGSLQPPGRICKYHSILSHVFFPKIMTRFVCCLIYCNNLCQVSQALSSIDKHQCSWRFLIPSGPTVAFKITTQRGNTN